MSGGWWLVTFLYVLFVVVIVFLVVILLIGLVAYSIGTKCSNKKRCLSSSSSSCEICPVYLLNPHPDKRVFNLSRVDGDSNQGNGCSTGWFTIQRINGTELLYSVNTPPDTLITDIYTLEVAHSGEFPLTADGCSADLSAYRHQTYDCGSTSNEQTFTSTLSPCLQAQCDILIGILVVFSTSENCIPLEMMTVSSGKPVPLTGNCTVTPCPPEACCDPIVPNYIRVHLPKCHLLDELPQT